MFRFFKFYSLYMNNTGFLASEEACVCEKLPRAVLHVPVNHYNVCDLCGMIRRPPTCSSDEEEKMDAERQKILLERRHAEEAAHLNKAARFKVAVKGKKPKVKSHKRRNKNDNGPRTEGGGLGEAGDGDGPKEASKMDRRQQEPSAPPPSSPSPAPSGSPCEDTTYTRRRLIYDDQFVKKFVPLKGPITDPSGGAISKRSGYIWGAPNPRISRPQGPLFKDQLQGDCSSKSKDKYTESQLASQFHPFDEYEGPSEDAIVEDSARHMLSRPNSLYIEPRPDLPNNRIGTHGSSLGRIWLASPAMPSESAPNIPEPPFGPNTNKSPLPEEITSETKGSNNIIDTSSSPIHQLTKSEEHPGNSEYEDILQDLGLIELSDEKDEPTVIELVHEDVFSSNKAMTDEEYSESISVQKHKQISRERECPVSRRKYHFKVANTICHQSIASRKPDRVALIIAPVTNNPLKRLFTRKLEILKRVQHMCAEVPMPQVYYVRQLVGRLSVSYVRKQRALSVLDICKDVPKNWQDNCRDDRHGIKSYNRSETLMSLAANPKEWHFIKQMNTKFRPVEKRHFKAEDSISVIKSLPAKCSRCRRHRRDQAPDCNPRKISRGSELELLKLKTGSKQRVCPVHSDTTKSVLCTHRIGRNRSENLETNKFDGKNPVIKMEKTMKTVVVTRNLITFYKVYHMSVDLPKLHLVSHVRQLSGILLESFVQQQPSMSFLEFRVPGIEISDLWFSRRAKKIEDNALRPETLIPRTADPSSLQSKNKARAVWPSMKLKHEKVLTTITYDQNFAQSDSLEVKMLEHRKKKITTVQNSLKLIEETDCARYFQEQKRKRTGSPVPVPETNQDSEGERKMILAIVKYFRSVKKPLKKKSRGF